MRHSRIVFAHDGVEFEAWPECRSIQTLRPQEHGAKRKYRRKACTCLRLTARRGHGWIWSC